MATAHDVAAHVLSRTGTITPMKLQKLVYYSQAWHLVWEERLLFPERIEAWANGPVVRDLYDAHRGQYQVGAWPLGDAAALDASERESIDVVVDEYGRLSGHDLSELTHREPPWRDARTAAGLADGERGTVEISPASMLEYYDSLVPPIDGERGA